MTLLRLLLCVLPSFISFIRQAAKLRDVVFIVVSRQVTELASLAVLLATKLRRIGVFQPVAII